MDTIKVDTVKKPISETEEITIYPNPVNGVLNIQSKDNATLNGKTAALYSLTGKPILQKMLQSKTEKINISNLNAGIYILKIGEGKNRKIFKVIKM